MKKYALLFQLLLVFASIFAQKAPFFDEIAALQKADSLTPPATGQVLFIGSSSFTLWRDVQLAFPGSRITNRAFGGSTLSDQIRYFSTVVVPCKPRQVVIYCGENDFAQDKNLTPEAVVSLFKTLFSLIKKHCGRRTEVVFVSMKPSPSRAHLMPKYIAANHEIARFLKKKRRTAYVDIWPNMLGPDGQPRRELFVDDLLHMNSAGYEIWQKAIGPFLLKN